MVWIQRLITLPPFSRGFHLITGVIQRNLPEIAGIRLGLLHLFLQHTSASLTINENASPEVRDDLETVSSAMAPESFPYHHSLEGPDDMPAHVKSSLFGVSLVIPVQSGRLALGTWQGIYLGEHRDEGGRRNLVATLHGESGA